MREATNTQVSSIDVEIERPVDRHAKQDVLAGDDSDTVSVTGTGGTSTLATNNSEGSWYLHNVTCQALGSGGTSATVGTVQVEVQVRDAGDAVVTAGVCDANGVGHIPFNGQIVRKSWDVHAVVAQSDSNSYDVTVIPQLSKPDPGPTTSQDDAAGTVPFDVIDDFEDQSLSEYTASSGSKGDFSFETSDVYWNEAALKYDVDSSAGIVSTSGLDHYHPTPESGGRAARIYVKSKDALDASQFVMFGVEDTNNFYRAELRWPDGGFHLEKVDGGSVDLLDSVTDGTVNWRQDRWYKVSISRFADGEVTVGVLDTTTGSSVVNGTFQDSAFTDADGVGYACEQVNNGSLLWDFFVK